MNPKPEEAFVCVHNPCKARDLEDILPLMCLKGAPAVQKQCRGPTGMPSD